MEDIRNRKKISSQNPIANTWNIMLQNVVVVVVFFTFSFNI